MNQPTSQKSDINIGTLAKDAGKVGVAEVYSDMPSLASLPNADAHYLGKAAGGIIGKGIGIVMIGLGIVGAIEAYKYNSGLTAFVSMLLLGVGSGISVSALECAEDAHNHFEQQPSYRVGDGEVYDGGSNGNPESIDVLANG